MPAASCAAPVAAVAVKVAAAVAVASTAFVDPKYDFFGCQGNFLAYSLEKDRKSAKGDKERKREMKGK